MMDGGSPATTHGHAKAFKLQGTEASTIAKVFKDKDFAVFQANGIQCEGVKYQFLREFQGNTVFAKRKDAGSVCLEASNSMVIIAHCKEGSQAGGTNKAVHVIADYMKSVGY